MVKLSSALNTVNHAHPHLHSGALNGTDCQCSSLVLLLLSNQQQFVHMDTSMFQKIPITCVVSLGSILSPVIFNLSMEPLSALLTNKSIKMHNFSWKSSLIQTCSASYIVLSSGPEYPASIWSSGQPRQNSWYLLRATNKKQHKPGSMTWPLIALNPNFHQIPSHVDGPYWPTSPTARKPKMCWYQLSLLKKVKLFLPESNFRTAAQALILSNMDGGNTLLHGFPDSPWHH